MALWLAEVIPVELAVIVYVFRDKIRKLVKETTPFVVVPEKVPTVVPEGDKVTLIVYTLLVLSIVLPALL